MREKYEALGLSDLKDIAKHRGIKGVSAMKKSQVIEAMLALDEQEKAAKAQTEAETAKADILESDKGEGTEQENGKPDRTAGNKPRQSRIVFNSRPSATGQSRPMRNRDNSEVKPRPSVAREAEHISAMEQDTQSVQSKAEIEPERYEVPYMEETMVLESAVEYRTSKEERGQAGSVPKELKNGSMSELDSGLEARGILEVLPEGFGFIRSDNYMPGDQDVYVSPSQIRRFNLKTGDIVCGNTRVKTEKEKFSALLFIKSVNGMDAEVNARRFNFEDMTPIFPDERMMMERPGCSVAMRVMDLLSPIGKGQRGMIVSPPKAGKTTLLKEVAQSIQCNHPDVHLIILLIDERPEEVTDIKEAIQGDKVEVIHSTFDELPEHHKRVAEMTIERAKRLVEHKQNVCILLDSITRLTRAYNLTVPPSGRTLSGGLDPASLHMPKRFFGAARNMREGGSLTILATALVDTGSKMDDVVYEEFKGTGNMEMILDRKLSEKRIFPAIDIPKSGTRREDLLLSREEIEAVNMMRRGLNGMKADEAVDKILDLFARTRNNFDFVQIIRKQRLF